MTVSKARFGVTAWAHAAILASRCPSHQTATWQRARARRRRRCVGRARVRSVSRGTGPSSRAFSRFHQSSTASRTPCLIVLQDWQVEVQARRSSWASNAASSDRIVPSSFVAKPGLDVVRRVGRIPLKIAVSLPRVAMLQMRRLPVSAQARAKQVAVVELLSWVARSEHRQCSIFIVSGPLWIRPMQ